MQNLKVWQVVEFEIEPAQEELACWLMMQMGSTGCQVHQNSASSVFINAIFEEMSCGTFVELRKALKQYDLEDKLKNLRTTTIADDDWLKKWKADLRPIHVGQNFVISPPWFREEVEHDSAGEQVIYIEPGMAFGTGLHATTQYCLQALEECNQRQKYYSRSRAAQNSGTVKPGDTDQFDRYTDILDLGTGSGILAIAAAKLNPHAKILALDISPTCIEVAQQNIRLNAVEQRISLQVGSTDLCRNLSFDYIVANLSYEDIAGLLIEFLRLLKSDGRLILAGILMEKLPLLEQAIKSYPLQLIDRKPNGEWVGVTLERIAVVVKSALKSPAIKT